MMCLRFCFSGSRDSKMALWLIQDEADETVANSQTPDSSQERGSSMDVPLYGHIRPQVIAECNKAEKVRALAYHSKRQVREKRHFMNGTFACPSLSMAPYILVYHLQDLCLCLALPSWHCAHIHTGDLLSCFCLQWPPISMFCGPWQLVYSLCMHFHHTVPGFLCHGPSHLAHDKDGPWNSLPLELRVLWRTNSSAFYLSL